MLEGILTGLGTAVLPMNLFMVAVGCFVGTFIGMLPGLGPISAIALMIPITYGLDPASGIILMAGVYYGAIFGGSTSSILINAPGCSGTVVTSFDGYPLAAKGQAGKALAIAAYASFTGGTISAIFLLVAAPMLAKVSLSFQSADYFALMVLGLSAVAAFSGRGQVIKALLMTVFGLMLSTVGTDRATGVERFTFGSIDLLVDEGITLSPNWVTQISALITIRLINNQVGFLNSQVNAKAPIAQMVRTVSHNRESDLGWINA